MRITYVSTSRYHNELKHQLTELESFSLGVMVRDFNLAFYDGMRSSQEIEAEAFSILKSLDSPRLNSVLGFPKTLQSLIHFIRECHLYGVSLSDLPQNTPLQKEIASVLRALESIIEKPRLLPTMTYRVNPLGLTHAEYSFCVRNKFDFMRVPMLDITPKFRYALNSRSEYEAIIQDIIRNGYSSATIAVPNVQGALPHFEAVIARYGTRLNLEDRTFEIVRNQYLSLVSFSLEPNIRLLECVIQANPLSLKYPRLVIQYIQHFHCTIDDLQKNVLFAKPNDLYDDMTRLQEKIKDDLLCLSHYLKDVSNLSYRECLIDSYNRIKDTPMDCSRIKRFLEENINLYSYENHALFINHLSKMKASSLRHESIQIVSYTDLPLIPTDVLYVSELTAQNFPHVTSRTGLIDEAYLSELKGYPSLDTRTEFELNKQHRIFQANQNTIFSYATTSYEGKSKEVSHEIGSFASKHDATFEPWHLNQLLSRKKTRHKLAPEYADHIYLKDSKIQGSITSFQLYLTDPYQYFLERGLKVKKPEVFSFNPMILGNLNHKIMENTYKNIETSPWTDLEAIFPMSHPQYRMIKDRNDELMKSNVSYLNRASETTTLSPTLIEYRFDDEVLFEGIHLRGIIDRIDTDDVSSMIIDYKSSPQSLSATTVKNGTQLQLLTYAVVAQHRFKENILGAFYFGLKCPAIDNPHLTYSLSKGVISATKSDETVYDSDRSYSGWFFEDIPETFSDPLYFTGLHESKAGGVKVRGTAYDLPKIETHLKYIYATIRKHILGGILDSKDIKIEIDRDETFKKEKDA